MSVSRIQLGGGGGGGGGGGEDVLMIASKLALIFGDHAHYIVHCLQRSCNVRSFGSARKLQSPTIAPSEVINHVRFSNS